MRYGKRKNLSVFGGGQRSFGVTLGQTLKTLLTPYLNVGSFDEFHIVCRCVMVRQRTMLFLVEVKGHLGSPEVKWSVPCKDFISKRVTVRDLILSI